MTFEGLACSKYSLCTNTNTVSTVFNPQGTQVKKLELKSRDKTQAKCGNTCLYFIYLLFQTLKLSKIISQVQRHLTFCE